MGWLHALVHTNTSALSLSPPTPPQPPIHFALSICRVSYMMYLRASNGDGTAHPKMIFLLKFFWHVHTRGFNKFHHSSANVHTHTHTRARRVSILFQCWKGLSVHLSCVNHSLYKRKCGNWDRGVCRVCIVPTSDTWYTSAPHSIQHSVLLVRYHPASPLWIIN